MSNSDQLSFKRLFSSPVAWLSFAVFLSAGFLLNKFLTPKSDCNPPLITLNTLDWNIAKQYVYTLRPITAKDSLWGSFVDLSQVDLDNIHSFLNTPMTPSNPTLPGSVRLYLGSDNIKGYYFLSPIARDGSELPGQKISYFNQQSANRLPCPRYCDIKSTAMGYGGAPPHAD